MAHLLEVKSLSVGIKRGGGFLKAVNDISFLIAEGEILGLAGESGCGKSLTALSVAGLLPDAAEIIQGKINYSNQSLTSHGEEEMRRIRGKEISMIFQEARQALNPLLRVGDQITETLELGGSKNREQNKNLTLEMLKQLGFDEPKKIFDAFPYQLSGGMCQRVMTAIAAVNKPRLLLADEPSSSLDLESQERILSLLVQMNRDFKTSVLIISHDLSVIRQFCTRYLVMYAGRIVEECPAKVSSPPLHPYTKAMFGAIPGKDKRGKNLENIPGKVPSIEDSFSGCPFAPRCRKAQSICMESFPPAAEIGGGKAHCFFPETGEVNG